ncbi:disease resistance protein RUN1-like [Juglans regia]|uniref:Disease resistance protein RUN1-like n=1 Tax=Juglans regia TaxID=51240 RepID=A0A6P9EEX1_JUGRE|nr:disease resistance protein RUN1-like [Juglans regia]
MMKLLDMESNDVRFVGIHGMGGVGKTTLAQIIYDRVSNSYCRFEGSSFISCIREESKARGLASLQKQLLSMIIQEEIQIWDRNQGDRMRKKMLSNKRVFIVLDDVDSDEQLTALAGDRKWFGPGSRVIITCRDSHLLKTHEVNNIYKVEELQTDEALQLFSLSAFKKTHPTENYKDLSMDFVEYAQGLPLALKVLGSFLFGRTIVAWRSARDQLEAIPNKEIMNILQISFEGLEDFQKELFLDMACLFQPQYRLDNIFLQTLESFGYYPGINIDVLVDKSLLTISDGMLFMHDLLKTMGHEIVRRECPEEPGRRSRLFRVEDLYHVLKNDTGTDATKAIVVEFCPETKDQRLNARVLDNLKVFDLSYSENLIEIPDFSGVPNLEEINLEDCRSLCELHPSIGSLKHLNELVLNKCSSLEKLPDLSSLECLTYLEAYETAITQIPCANLMPKSIREFSLQGGKLMRLKSKDPIYDIGSLVEYRKEGIYDYVEATWIDVDSKGENILDMAGVVVSAMYDDLTTISIWSLGFYIPEWVQYKSNGSSVKIDLDANTNPEMGCVFFIVCDSDQFFSMDYGHSSISSLFKGWNIESSEMGLTIRFERDKEYCVEYDSLDYRLMDVSFSKRIGFWVYIPAVLRLPFLDIRRVIKISFETGWYYFQGRVKPIEVKECGVHFFCPDDANSKFFNSIAPFGHSGSSNSDFHRRFVGYMRKKKDMKSYHET